MKHRLHKTHKKLVIAAVTLIACVAAATTLCAYLIHRHQLQQPQPVKNLMAAPAAARPLILSIAAANDRWCRKNIVGIKIGGSTVTVADLPRLEMAEVNKVAPNKQALSMSISCYGGAGHFLVNDHGTWKDLGPDQFGTLECTIVDKYRISRTLLQDHDCFTDSQGHTAPVMWP